MSQFKQNDVHPQSEIHQPVMVDEVLTALGCGVFPDNTDSEKVYVDCTLGLGGHTAAILEATAPNGRVIGIDRDGLALKMAEKRLAEHEGRFTLRKGTFKELLTIVSDLGYTSVDGVLFDFGISSYQLDTAGRGFSFQQPGPLDMRMDSETGKTAADLVNHLPEKELARLIRVFGEERWADRIALGIVHFRTENGEIKNTEELENIIWRATPARFRHGRTHPATRTFQALRMVVNDEIEQIEAGLSAAISLLRQGGRLVVISFHSLEDRCVKHTFRAFTKKTHAQKEQQFINLYKKPLMASPEETAVNRRARSAKLRALLRAA
ncbi:MAG: 16S rRNA (cytosine(1402)-N(4))-methyltransferase RsmH [Nitrospiria bacterium]